MLFIDLSSCQDVVFSREERSWPSHVRVHVLCSPRANSKDTQQLAEDSVAPQSQLALRWELKWATLLLQCRFDTRGGKADVSHVGAECMKHFRCYEAAGCSSQYVCRDWSSSLPEQVCKVDVKNLNLCWVKSSFTKCRSWNDFSSTAHWMPRGLETRVWAAQCSSCVSLLSAHRCCSTSSSTFITCTSCCWPALSLSRSYA